MVALLKLAPSGFPTHNSLKIAFIHLDSKYSIFCPKKTKGRATDSSNAADVWRVMCKDVYNMKRSGVHGPEMTELVDRIVLRAIPAQPAPPCPRGQAALPRPRAPPSEPPVPDFAEFSDVDSALEEMEISDSDVDDDVEVVKVTCRCPDCLAGVPSAAIGGQRRETEISKPTAQKPTRRLRGKQSLKVQAAPPKSRRRK